MKKYNTSVKRSKICQRCGYELNIFDKVVNFFDANYNRNKILCSSCMADLKKEMEKERVMEVTKSELPRNILNAMLKAGGYGYGANRNLSLLNTKIANDVYELAVKLNFSNQNYDHRNTYDNKMESKIFYFECWLGNFIQKIRELNAIYEYNEIFIKFYGDNLNEYGNIISNDRYAWIKINTGELDKINYNVLKDYQITNIFEYEIGTFPNNLE